MPLPVYHVEYLGSPNHEAIFVRLSEADGSGLLFHVIGNIQEGMKYECRSTKRPEDSLSFVGKNQVGWISSSDLQRFKSTCESNPPPAKQFNGPRRIDPRKPLRRCGEWAAESLQALKSNGVLKSSNNHSNTGSSAPQKAFGQPSHSSSSHASSSLKEPIDGQQSGDGYWTWSSKYGDWYHVGKDGRTIWSKNQGSGSGAKSQK